VSLLLDLLYPRDYYQPHYRDIKVKSIRRIPGFDGILSLFPYHFPINNLLHDLKYRFVTDLIPDLVDLSVSTLKSDFPNLLEFWQQQHFVLVPVPLHSCRQNWRGFNQSDLLAESLAQKLSLSFCSDLVVRHQYTTPQAKIINKSIRKTNIQNTFSLNSASIPPNIILFDDVITSGSTISSLASVLPKTCHLWALSIAG
jgi:ComF family protein